MEKIAPFRSKAQARFMFARHPEMAKRWAKHTPSVKALPEKKAMLIEKIARKQKVPEKEKADKKPYIAVIGGSIIAKKSWPALTGRKKVYHGTTAKAFEGIKREGIRPKYEGGASRGLADPVRLSKGHVYVTEYPKAARFMSHQALHPELARGLKDTPGALLMQYRVPKHGKLLTIMMGYEKWTKMKADPEALVAADISVFVDVMMGKKIPTKVPPSHPLYKEIKAMSARGRQIIHPSEIRGASKVHERAFKVLKNLPKYIKKYPSRFSVAVAGTIAGAGLIGYGAKGIAEQLGNTKK